jgi:DNA-binding NarL/FixJ family response regulator
MIRVIIAEDHKIVREGIKQLISLAEDISVVGEATNGTQLLEQLRQISADVLLLDISMPGTNGLETIPRIRALDNPPAILMLSMHDEVQIAARALKAGAAGYSTKDSDPALLLTAIRKVASGGATSTRNWPTAWCLKWASPIRARRTPSCPNANTRYSSAWCTAPTSTKLPSN